MSDEQAHYRDLELDEIVTSDCQCKFDYDDEDGWPVETEWGPVGDGHVGKTVAEIYPAYFSFRKPCEPPPRTLPMANASSPHYGFIRMDVQFGPIHDQMAAFSVGIEKSLFHNASHPIDWTDDTRIRLVDRKEEMTRQTLKDRELLCELIARDIRHKLMGFLAQSDTRNGYPIPKDTTHANR